MKTKGKFRFSAALFYFFLNVMPLSEIALTSECDTMGGPYVRTCDRYGVMKELRQGP
jgi:hypothetical protein